jgi:predicted permease
LTSSLALGIGISPSRGDEKKDKLITKKRPPLLSSSFLRQWICVSLARFIVSPILVLTLLHSFHGVGVIPHFEQDPVLWFVSVLQGCMPSAQNLVLMLQVANKEDKAGAIAKFLFFVYATSMIPVVFIVSATLRRFGLA